MPLPTREIDEIVQLHIREGTKLQEVFVEGLTDKRFYESFLIARGLPHVAVLDVGSVNVPDNEVLKVGQPTGKKGRVVALAASLEGRLTENQVVCIADADLDHFKGVSYRYSLLLITDYTSIELHICCPAVMHKILSVGLGGFEKTHRQVTEELADLLQDAFMVRVAADDLALAPKYPKHSSFCHFDKKRNVASFHLTAYVDKAFEGYTSKEWRDPLYARIDERRMQLKADFRLQVHGHDFLDTFAWYVRQHSGHGEINPSTFAKVALAFIDADALAGEPMFQELLRRLHLTTTDEGASS